MPPRVRDIPNHENSWGWITVSGHAEPAPVAQDELGYLWVNSDAVPQYRIPDDSNEAPGALVFWTEPAGIGLWVHPKSLRHLPAVSRLDMKPDGWLPVNEVTEDWPAFIKQAT